MCDDQKPLNGHYMMRNADYLKYTIKVWAASLSNTRFDHVLSKIKFAEVLFLNYEVVFE